MRASLRKVGAGLADREGREAGAGCGEEVQEKEGEGVTQQYIDELHEAIASNGRPWSPRASELYEKEGHWADYAAWREWIAEQTRGDTDEEILDVLEHPLDINLYTMCCKLADGAYLKATASP